MTRLVPFLIFSLALAACSGSGTVDLESRDIAVEQNAEPTSGAAGAAGVSSVAHLLPGTSPTYVTLTISQVDSKTSGSKAESRRRAVTSGSGFIAEGSGYVMTAAHVAVAKGYLVSARAANGRIYSGAVVAINPTNDVAIIKLRGYAGRAAAPSAPGCAAMGDLVFTLGKPHAQGDIARVGRLESLHFGRAVAYGKFGYPDALVLRMSTQKGESGGPLFNGKGELVGMVVSTLSDGNGKSINIAHAVPSTALAHFLCAETKCSNTWLAIARTTVDGCSET